jgi:hypothetical protein
MSDPISRPVINGPAPIAPPAARSMDNIPPEAQIGFGTMENNFFSAQAHERDEQILMKSVHGYFRIFNYSNQNNPNDRQAAVFFYNKHSEETFELHGTIARFFIEKYRNNGGINDFPIANERASQKDSSNKISRLSQFILLWGAATNNVLQTVYKEFTPEQENTLIAYGEEYDPGWNNISVRNWKKFGSTPFQTKEYVKSRSYRGAGAPTQILLHETAGFGNLTTPSAVKDGNNIIKYFAIPHFTVNNPSDDGQGNLLQFADVAENVPHGEILNDRAVGIEFVNAPQEEYKDGKPIYNLEKSVEGIYLSTKLAKFPKLFIPLQFSDKAEGEHFELAVPKDKLLNLAALRDGVGKDKTKIIAEEDKNIFLRYAKSDKFEHLASLVRWLTETGAVTHIPNLAEETFWKFVVRRDGKLVYLFQNAFQKQKGKTPDGKPIDETHFFVDIREPGLFYHMLIGSHRDGAQQGLYLYLKFVKKLQPQAILQTMIDMLTSAPTEIEKTGIKLESRVVERESKLYDATKPIEIPFADILEIKERPPNIIVYPRRG